jgi:hypothetical protein
MTKIYLLIFAIILFISCQTEIEVTIPTYYNKLVVEGYIENGEYPMVSLYRSAPYFSTMTMEYLMDSIVIQDAKVFVTTSKGDKHELFFTMSPQAPLFLAYTTYAFKGELNTSYLLQIEWNDKVYTSETAILNTFDLDSVKFVPNFGHTEIDSVANLRIWMTDDGQPLNYYQFKVKIHCKDKGFPDRLWITTIPAAFDNSPFRGISFNYEIIRGAPTPLFIEEMTDRERRRYFRMDYRMGDTVYLKYARLEESAYRFWQSASGEITFGQNPFMSPTPITSNIRCNTGEQCLGVWSGSAAKEVVLIFDSTTTKAPRSALGFR